MRAGRLDRWITVQRGTSSPGTDGHPSVSWTTLGETRTPAGYVPLRGEERASDPQYVAREQVEFIVRYASVFASLSPLDRVVYPAFEADSPASPETGRTYDILSVTEIGRREGLRILAVRRTDVT